MRRSRPRLMAGPSAQRRRTGPVGRIGAIAAAVAAIGVLAVAGSTFLAGDPGGGTSRELRRAGRSRRRELRGALATAGARPRGVRLRPVLGDGRHDRGPRRRDAAEHARALLGHAPQQRLPRRGPERLQADHRARRPGRSSRAHTTASCGSRSCSTRASAGRRTQLFGATGEPGQGDRLARRVRARPRGRRHQRRRRGDRRRRSRRTARFVGRLRTALRGPPTGGQVSVATTRRPTGAAMAPRPRRPAPTGSS